MSHPISSCMIARACMHEAGYTDLRESMRINMECGHYMTFGCECKCEPKCITPTPDQITALNARLKEDLKDVKRHEAPKGALGSPGCLGT